MSEKQPRPQQEPDEPAGRNEHLNVGWATDALIAGDIHIEPSPTGGVWIFAIL